LQLLIGNSGLSLVQSQAQMAIWCILPAPLFMSNDPRFIEPKFEAILLNRDAIAVNQDKLTTPGERIFHNQTLDIWRRELSNNTLALVVLNREMNAPLRVRIPLQQIANERINKSDQLQVFNIFQGSSLLLRIDRTKSNWIDARVEPTGVAFLRLQPL